MILPKLTRQRLYAARGVPIEITIPEGEQCGEQRRYALQSSRGGKRLATIFIQTLEHRGEQRVAMVVLTDEPRFMAPVSGSTPDAARSIDKEAELVPAHYQKQLDTEAHSRFAQHREEADVEAEDRRQERAVRQQIREAVSSLPPAARKFYLAGVERAAKEQLEQMKEAA